MEQDDGFGGLTLGGQERENDHVHNVNGCHGREILLVILPFVRDQLEYEFIVEELGARSERVVENVL